MEPTPVPAAACEAAPLILRAAAVARLFGYSEATFYRKRKGFEKRGFPLRSALVGGWHRDAVVAWIANHFGLATTLTDPYSLEASREKLKDVSFKATRRAR